MKPTKQKLIATLLASPLILSACLFVLVPSASAFTENSYRWRNDNGSETAATNAAAENAALSTASIGVNQRLRFGMANSGSESEYSRTDHLTLEAGDDYFKELVIDTAGGYLYAAEGTSPARVLKIRLSDHSVAATLTLSGLPVDQGLESGVIDVSAGFMYFGNFNTYDDATTPGRIVKVRISDFTQVATLTLAAGENNLRSSFLDTSGPTHYAYFVTYGATTKLIKIDLSSFTETGSLALSAGFSYSISSGIDAAAGFAYIGAFVAPAKIAKVNLATFTEDSILTLPSGVGEDQATAIVINTASTPHHLYMAAYAGKIVKIDLSTFTRVGVITLSVTTTIWKGGAIDAVNGFAYFAGYSSPGRIFKIDLSTFLEISTFSLATSENSPSRIALDVAAGFGYVGTVQTPGRIIKFSLAAMTETSALTPGGGESAALAPAVDDGNGFAYVPISSSPVKVVKIRLSDSSRVSVITLPGFNLVGSAVLDVASGYLYIGSAESPAQVAKIRLSDFSLVSSITLATGLNNARRAAIDTVAGYLYFTFLTSPAKVAKISLSSFTQVDTLTFATGENNASALLIDGTGPTHYLYVGISSKFKKVDLTTFTETASLTLGQSTIGCGLIDLVGGNIYASNITTGTTRIAKVALSSFTEVASITLPAGEAQLTTCAIDSANGFAYFSTFYTLPLVTKINLSTFTRVSALTLNQGEDWIRATYISANGNLYIIPSYFYPSRIVRISTAPKSQFRLEYGLKTSTCAAIGSWTQVPTTAGPTDAWQMADSGFFIDDAASSNNAGLTDGNTSFNPGVVKDASSQTGDVSLGEKQFTEVEYSVKPVNDSTIGSNYCFRLTNAGSTTGFVYTQYAEATVAPRPPSGSGGCSFVIRPNGGEHMTAGQSYEIQWSHSSCQSQAARISLSTDGGGTYPTLIADKEPEDGTYTWTVPDINTTSAKVKVELLMGGIVQGADASDSDFSITGTPGSPSSLPPTLPPPSAAPSYSPSSEAESATSIDVDQGWQPVEGPHSCIPGTALKSVSSSAVYYCGSDGKKHVFPNEKTYKTWFEDFTHVITYSDETIAAIPEGKTITYKPGVKMVKLPTDDKTYAVSAGGVLRWVTSEATAAQLYGADWNKKIDDLTESTFDDYTIGQPI